MATSSAEDESDSSSKTRARSAGLNRGGDYESGTFRLSFSVDVVEVFMFVLAFSARVYNVTYPRSVVFDELITLNHVRSYVATGVFFFDQRPPLGKQLLAIPAALAEWRGGANATRVGSPLPEGSAPLLLLRTTAAFLCSLASPLLYRTLALLGVRRAFAALGAFIIATDSCMITEGRFAMPDGFAVTFVVGALMCYLKAEKASLLSLSSSLSSSSSSSSLSPSPVSSSSPPPVSSSAAPSVTSKLSYSMKQPLASLTSLSSCSRGWLGSQCFTELFWLTACGITCGAATSIQYSCGFTLLLVWWCAARAWWRIVPRADVSGFRLFADAVVRVLTLCVIPVCVHLLTWRLHIALLPRIVSGQTYGMKPVFVSSLEGGVATLLNSQPREVTHGSAVTLRASLEKHTCWLHSHAKNYPVKYEDGRGSSHQQQVTCYPFKDANNWWFVRRARSDGQSPYTEFPARAFRHGDLVELHHGTTHRKLNSHNVAAPLSPHLMEVSGYVDYNVSMPAQSIWRVEVASRGGSSRSSGGEGAAWKAVTTEVRLIHVNTTQALVVSGKSLPEWGGKQYEVATDKMIDRAQAYWTVEEHKYFTDPEKGEAAEQLMKSGIVPSEKDRLTPWQMVGHILWKQWMAQASNSDTQSEHRFASGPLDWPLGRTNMVYWIHPQSNAQIAFAPNALIWTSLVVAAVCMVGMIIIEGVLRQRDSGFIGEPQWIKLCSLAEITIGGYLLHYIPFFMSDAQLFVFSYIPALAFAVLTLCVFVDVAIDLVSVKRHRFVWGGVMGWVVAVGTFSWCLAPLIYGERPLDHDSAQWLRKNLAWDFVQHES